MNRWLALVALGGVWSLPPAQAQDRPLTLPARDVTVTYMVKDPDSAAGSARTRTIKVYWAKAGALMRIEMPDEKSYVLLDRDKRRLYRVMPDQHGYVETPYDPQRPIGLIVPPADAPLTRLGTEIIAGNSCTRWQMKTGLNSQTLCVTDEGVVLRADGSDPMRRGDIEATSIIYGPQPSVVFMPPADFQRLDMKRPADKARPPG